MNFAYLMSNKSSSNLNSFIIDFVKLFDVVLSFDYIDY